MKTLIKVALLVVAGVAVPSGFMSAQDLNPAPSSRVKVVLNDGKEIRGEFRSWTDEGLSIIAPGSQVGMGKGMRKFAVLNKAEVREVWLKTGERSATGRRLGKALKVTALGALIGAGVGYASAEDSWLFSRGDQAALGAMGFAIPMAIGGLLWAAVGKDEVWTRITPDWERSQSEGLSSWVRSVDWSAGVTQDGQLVLGVTLRT